MMHKGSRKTQEEEASQQILVLADAFKDVLNTFISKRERTIQLLKYQVEMLNSCRKTGNITKITGAGVAIAGAVAGVVSVPLTGGLSLVALGVGVIGGAAGIGGDMYVSSREQTLMDETEQILDNDSIEANNLEKSARALQAHVDYMSLLGISLDYALTFADTVKQGVSVAKKIPYLGKIAKLGMLTKLGKFAKGASSVLSVVFIPLDIIEIVQSTSELTRDNSEKALIVQNAIDDLERDLVEKKKLAN